jgi:hypothetical protein
MDVFADAVKDLDAAWQPQAASAASGVTLTFDGRPVRVAADGTFRVRAGARGTLEAVDGAGGRTAIAVGAPASGSRPTPARRRSLASLRRLRGRRLRVVLRCPAPCSGAVRVRAGRRVLARRSVRLSAAGRRSLTLRLHGRLPRRARVSFPRAHTRTIRLR